MEYIDVFGNTFSRLMLGTVALGLDYGVANKGGQPGAQESRQILDAALEVGINVFDTARTYGTAEDRVGAFIGELDGKVDAALGDGFRGQLSGAPLHIVTKFKISPQHLGRSQEARAEAFGSVRESLRRLRREQVEVCLFHNDRDLPMDRVKAVLPGILEDLQQQGLVRVGGVSIDHPDEALPFLDEPSIQAFQVPVNLFDQRLIGSGLIRQMKEEGRAVFARSVFLQGLFFLDPDQLSGSLAPAAGWLRQLREIAAGEGMSVAQLAFSYIRDLDGISSIVFGAESVRQVRQTAALQEGRPLSATARVRIGQAFGFLPEEIITPRFWRA